MNKKKIFIAVGIIAIIAVFIVVAIMTRTGDKTSTGIARDAIPVQVEKVKMDTIVSKVTASGIVDVANKQSLYVNSPLKVENVSVEVGDKVSKDQELVKYDTKSREDIESQLEKARMNLEIQEINLKSMRTPPKESDLLQAKSAVSQAEKAIQDAQAALKQTEINLAQTQRSMEDAREQLQKNQTLYNQGAISLTELDQSKEKVKSLEDQLEIQQIQIESGKLAIESAKQQKAIAEENLQNIVNPMRDPKQANQIEVQKKQVELQKLQIQDLEKQLNDLAVSTVSTMDGTILTLNVESGSIVNQNYPVVEIGDLTKLVIKVDVSEYDAPSIKKGQKVILTGDSLGDASYEGKITKISPTAVSKQTGNGNEPVVQVEVEVSEKDTLLKSGYTIEAEVVTANRENVTVVPIISLLKEKDGTYVVYIVRDDYTAERRVVQVGAYSDLYVEVSGVEKDEKVISNPSPKISDGTNVKPIETSQSGDQNDNN